MFGTWKSIETDELIGNAIIQMDRILKVRQRIYFYTHMSSQHKIFRQFLACKTDLCPLQIPRMPTSTIDTAILLNVVTKFISTFCICASNTRTVLTRHKQAVHHRESESSPIFRNWIFFTLVIDDNRSRCNRVAYIKCNYVCFENEETEWHILYCIPDIPM